MSEPEPPSLDLAAAAPQPLVMELAGFWRRAAAFVVDALVLMFIGFLLGLGLSSFFRSLGSAGRVVGFLIATLYFTALDGPLGGGRSPGKRLLGIRVAGEGGEPLGWVPAAMRGAFLGLLMAVNGYPAEPDMRDPVSAALMLFSLLVAATFYRVVFERARRQGLHDLAASSFVLRAASPWAEPPPPGRVHLVMTAALPVVLCAAGFFIMARISETATFKPMLAARAAVRSHVGSSPVGISFNRYYMNGHVEDVLQVTVFYFQPPSDPEATAGEVARAVLDSGYPTGAVSAIGVNIVDGYTIGINSISHGHNFVHGVGQWTMPAHLSDIQRTTPQDVDSLIQMAIGGSIEDLEKLLKDGADPNKKDATGDSPLVYAVQKGRADSARMLISYSADPDIRNGSGRSPLMVAAAAGNTEIVGLLLARHVDADAKETLFGTTALHAAVDAGQSSTAKALLAAGVNVNAADKDGRTPLWHSKNRGHPELAEMLVKAGARE
jgi:uncharacterized RDD family membrane protein YckC